MLIIETMIFLSNLLIILKAYTLLIINNIIWLHLLIILVSVIILVRYIKKINISKKDVVITRALDYKINSLLDFYVSFFVLTIYFLIFFVSIITLRIKSFGRDIDLKLIVTNLYNFYKINNYLYIIIVTISIICILIWLIITLNYIYKLVRFHANRLHILFCEDDTKSTSYTKIPTFALYNYYRFSTQVYKLIKNSLPEKYSSKLFIKLLELEENFSLVLFTLGCMYDIIFNNYTIHVIFYLLPCILIYKLYRDILYFYHSRLYFDLYDCALYNLIYKGSIGSMNDEDITVISVENYVQRGFKPKKPILLDDID